jgi:hypothetical protein
MTEALLALAFLVVLMRPEFPHRHVYTAGYIAAVGMIAVSWAVALAAVLWSILRMEGKL